MLKLETSNPLSVREKYYCVDTDTFYIACLDDDSSRVAFRCDEVLWDNLVVGERYMFDFDYKFSNLGRRVPLTIADYYPYPEAK